MASRVAALLLLALICFGLAAASMPTDCCLEKIDKKVPPVLIKSYSLQEAGKGCDISAAVFFTVNERKLCVFHPSESQQIRRVIEYLNKKKKQ